MPTSVFGSTSISREKKLDTSSFVQKPYLRTNYIENISEEDVYNKNQKRKSYAIQLIGRKLLQI